MHKESKELSNMKGAMSYAITEYLYRKPVG